MIAAAGQGSTWTPPSQLAPHTPPAPSLFPSPSVLKAHIPQMKRQILPSPPLLSIDAHQIIVKIRKIHKSGEVSSPSQGADGSQGWDPAAHPELKLPPGLAATGTNLQEHLLPRAAGEEGTGGGHVLHFKTCNSKSSQQM